jgi:hypothetical protein
MIHHLEMIDCLTKVQSLEYYAIALKYMIPYLEMIDCLTKVQSLEYYAIALKDMIPYLEMIHCLTKVQSLEDYAIALKYMIPYLEMIDCLTKVQSLEDYAIALKDLVPRFESHLSRQSACFRRLYKDSRLLWGALHNRKKIYFKDKFVNQLNIACKGLSHEIYILWKAFTTKSSLIFMVYLFANARKFQ